MNDLIDRQAAIDAINRGLPGIFFRPVGEFLLHNVPSAYPETDGFCTDCKEYDSEKHFCPRFNRVIKKTVEEMGIIHCNDCKHGELFSDQYLCHKDMLWREGDFYCGDAERRTDE